MLLSDDVEVTEGLAVSLAVSLAEALGFGLVDSEEDEETLGEPLNDGVKVSEELDEEEEVRGYRHESHTDAEEEIVKTIGDASAENELGLQGAKPSQGPQQPKGRPMQAAPQKKE